MKTRAEITKEEMTRDPIFLFQRRIFHGVIPYCSVDYDYDSETYKDDDGNEYTEEQLILEDLAITSWETESVWLTREEAEAFGHERSYRYGKHRINWRVFCTVAEGELIKVLDTQENLSVALYELDRLRHKFDLPERANVISHIRHIEEYLKECMSQLEKV